MTEIFFMIRHTPFWAVPLIVICLEFGYVFWLRKKIRAFKICTGLVIFSFFCLTFYIYAGGPERAVRKVINIIRDFN
jgi:hypothetical protein